MPETDAYGHSEARNLELGLYLVVESRVPEDVVNTTAPFPIFWKKSKATSTNTCFS